MIGFSYWEWGGGGQCHELTGKNLKLLRSSRIKHFHPQLMDIPQLLIMLHLCIFFNFYFLILYCYCSQLHNQIYFNIIALDM